MNNELNVMDCGSGKVMTSFFDGLTGEGIFGDLRPSLGCQIDYSRMSLKTSRRLRRTARTTSESVCKVAARSPDQR